jgi:hypothetical protein
VRARFTAAGPVEALLRAALVREGAASTLDAEGSVDDILIELTWGGRSNHHQLGDQPDLLDGLVVLKVNVECVSHVVLPSRFTQYNGRPQVQLSPVRVKLS